MTIKIITILTILLTGVKMFASDLSSLNDEFDKSSDLKTWQHFHEAEGWPTRIDSIKVENGSLLIEPKASAWVADLQGVFLFKDITGDFIVTTRVHVNGKNSEKSKNDWALAGLMARTPKEETKEHWKANTENWVYLMHGKSPYPLRGSITDSKSNINSKWDADLTGSKNGLELRIVRLGSLLVTMRKFPGKEWVILDRFVRNDMPKTLQVGINTAVCNELYKISDFEFNSRTSYFKDEIPDMTAKFDYVHYRRPNIKTTINAKTSDKELLSILGNE